MTKTGKKIASSLLAGALVMGGIAPIAMFNQPAAVAFAADDEVDAKEPTMLSIKTPASAEAAVATGTSYTAIKVFNAEITGAYDDEDAPTASGISFATGVDASVIQGDEENEGEDAIDLTNAQNAAEWVGARIDHQPGVGLNASTYGMELAKRLIAAGADTKTIVADGEAVDMDGEGYWLIVRTADLNEENAAASSPIYAALDEGNTEITLKVAIPTIEKLIQEDDIEADDESEGWGDEADHTLNQDVNYKLVGTIADNIDAYKTYEYNFVDSWDGDKLELHADSVKVVVLSADEENEDGETVPGTETDITKNAGVAIDTATDGKLNVSIEDLKTVYPALKSTDRVIVSYTAEQCGTTASPEGIQNDAYLEYSNNPVMKSKGFTPEVSVKDYSFALRIHKTDNQTGEDLAGVEFSIKSDNGNYLAFVDGEVKEVPVAEGEDIPVWTTDADGRIILDGVDAATYTVEETKALDGYDMLGSTFDMTIDSATKTAPIGSFATTSELVSEDATAVDKDEVVKQVLVKNVKQIPLPSTGEMGIALVIFLAIAAGIYGVSRRKREQAAEVMHV